MQSPCEVTTPLARFVVLAHGGHFGHQGRLANDLFQAPTLQLGQRPRLPEAHEVPHMRFVLIIVGIKLLADRNDPTVERVRFLARHFHYDRLVHLVGDDFPNDFFAPAGKVLCRFCHHFFSVAACTPRARSPRIVFTRAMSLRRPRIFFRLSVCPMLSWNLSLNSWSDNWRS